jgi:hypothetical protein
VTRALKISVSGNCTNETVYLNVKDQSDRDVQGAALGIYIYNTGALNWDSVANLTTDANGNASFVPDSAGSYKAVATKAGYPSQTKFFSIGTCGGGGPTPTPTVSPGLSPTPNATATPTPTNCVSSGDCAGYERCVGGICRLVQGACGYAANHTWVSYECCAPGDCAPGMACAEHACVPLNCTCGRIENNTCVPYECCADSGCSGGARCVGNACRVLPPTTIVLVPLDPRLPILLVDAPNEVDEGDTFSLTAVDGRGSPAPGVVTRVFGKTFVTGADGISQILAETPGEQVMRISKDGYPEMEKPLLVRAVSSGLLGQILKYWWVLAAAVCGLGVVAAAVAGATVLMKPKGGA